MPLIVNGVEVTKLSSTIQEFLQFTSEKDDQLKVIVGHFVIHLDLPHLMFASRICGTY